MRSNAALRTRDIKKLNDTWGEGREYTPSMLKSLIARAIASYLGIHTLSQLVDPVESKPGRPRGVRGVKQGTGRRSVEGMWTQAELEEAGEWLEACSELMAIEHKWPQRPSLALTLAIIASKSPRPLDQWKCKAPRWAATAWLLSNQEPVEEPVEPEDFVELTEEQLKELENV